MALSQQQFEETREQLYNLHRGSHLVVHRLQGLEGNIQTRHIQWLLVLRL